MLQRSMFNTYNVLLIALSIVIRNHYATTKYVKHVQCTVDNIVNSDQESLCYNEVCLTRKMYC